MGRRPNKLDRAYFEKKKNPKYDDKDAIMECCGEPKARNGMMKGNKHDWSLIENHIEEHLRMYSSTKSVEPINANNQQRMILFAARNTEIILEATANHSIIDVAFIPSHKSVKNDILFNDYA